MLLPQGTAALPFGACLESVLRDEWGLENVAAVLVSVDKTQQMCKWLSSVTCTGQSWSWKVCIDKVLISSLWAQLVFACGEWGNKGGEQI